MTGSAKEKIIVALDVPDRVAAEGVLEELAGTARWCKVGMQLFTREGPAVVAAAKARGMRVFLDLKFHDIPNTVASGVESARELGVDMLTVHLCGGPEMLERAVAAAGGELLLLGVTVLTSSTEATLAAVGVAGSMAEAVERMAGLAVASGVPGIVCSPLELAMVREKFGTKLKTVTPGVRPAGSERGDQQRVMAPGDAVRAGADWLVIGRPIIGAADRRAAFEAIAAEIAAA